MWSQGLLVYPRVLGEREIVKALEADIKVNTPSRGGWRIFHFCGNVKAEECGIPPRHPSGYKSGSGDARDRFANSAAARICC